jgi:radical SAM superfamily enzyme YgiQ (UPF0313 family)
MEIYFADLTHTGHNCNAVPYGIALVAAYALDKIGPEISVRLVKRPTELATFLEEGEPGMVCFSTFIWNAEISCAFAGRIKEKYPKCITVFGGPHYPVEAARQLDYLSNNPQIDYFVHREGEAAFVHLYQALRGFGFDSAKLKAQGIAVQGCHYCHEGKLIAGSVLPLINPLDILPSPFLTGLCDQFLEQRHTVVIQFARGCPFGCTYCQEGADYYTPVRRYSNDRIKSELRYVAARAAVPTLFLADSNFGMYSEDLQAALALAKVQGEHGWPEFVVSISGKNNKDRVLATAATIRGGMFSAAIQSSDPGVLENINRRNVSVRELIESATEQDLQHTHSFSELIVALPGDTLTAHCKSATDLIDAGIHVVRSHQLLMLPGAAIASEESRRQFGLQTRFRVIHNTVNTYSLFGQSFNAPEIDEICVASNTLSFQDYLDCRSFDLTVEIFYNNGVFSELHAFLKQQDITISSFVMHLNRRVWDNPQLAELYSGFLEDTQELWSSRDELTAFLRTDGVLERYQNGELGRNEQLAYKALAIFEKMELLIGLAYEVAADLLQHSGRMSPAVADYLDQLKLFDQLRKQNPMRVGNNFTALFHYDFCKMAECGFNEPPWEYRSDEEVELCFSASAGHQQFVEEMDFLLRSGLHGYATIISINPKIREYFREVSRAGKPL